MSDVVVLTCTEFGRTVKQNASGGTDHGRGSVWLLFGGGIKGDLYHGDAGFVNTLTPENLDSGRYLRPTVDYQDIFSDILVNHLGIGTTELGLILPDHVHKPVNLFV